MTEVLPETPAHHQALAIPTPAMPVPVAPAPPPHNVILPESPHSGVAPTHPSLHPGAHAGTPSVAHRGREKLHWGKEVWDRLDHAVHKEVERTRVAAKFLPVHRVPAPTTSVPSDIVIVPQVTGGGIIGPGPDGAPLVVVGNGAPIPPVVRWSPPLAPSPTDNSFAIDEGATTRLIEFWVEFSLTPQQVEHEGNVAHDLHGAGQPPHPAHDAHGQLVHPSHGEHGHPGHGHHGHSSAVTLATRAANILAQAEDMLIFNGLGAFTSPLYTNFVRWRANGEPTDWGLLEVVPVVPGLAPPPPEIGLLPASQVIQVPRKPPPAAGDPPSLYGENTFQAVTAGYAKLMGDAQYGPFALTLHNVPYADSFAPLPNTLIMPADRIAPLMTAGFRDSGTLDAPGATAAAAGVAAAAAQAAGAAAAVVQQAAANAAATFVINYGAPLVVAGSPPNPTPVNASVLAEAAKAGSLAAQAAGAGQPAADNMGEGAAFNAANLINGYPGLPQGGNPTPLAASGPPSFYGSLVSLGGNTMDLVVGIEPTVGFMQQDVDGNFRFRVFERLALRLKDIRAVIRLEFA